MEKNGGGCKKGALCKSIFEAYAHFLGIHCQLIIFPLLYYTKFSLIKDEGKMKWEQESRGDKHLSVFYKLGYEVSVLSRRIQATVEINTAVISVISLPTHNLMAFLVI